jgi:hypothetical protein
MTSNCIGLPQLLASHDVKKRQAEENYREQQHRQILHRISRNSLGRRPLHSCGKRLSPDRNPFRGYTESGEAAQE